MELQKAAGEVEISQLKQRVHEQEALLAERRAQLEKLEGEVETQQKTIDDLNFQKSQLEHDVHQYRTKLEITMTDKSATEQELSHTKLIIEQSEAKWSLAQRRLEELLKKTNEEPDLEKEGTKLKRKIIVEEGTEEELQSQVQAKANDISQQPLATDSQSTVNSEPAPAVTQSDLDALQQKLEELILVQKRAEIAEEKAQSYKKLLDDSNNRMKKLQMDMESERISMRQKSDELQQDLLNMKKSISELQEEIKSLQRAKSALEQTTFFQSTEVEGLKEQLKITQGELHKKNSSEQDNIFKIGSLEEEVASKQTIIDQLKFKCNELTRINVSFDGDIQGLQIQTESLERERLISEQKIKSLKSEIESWRQQLQTAKEEITVMKKSEQVSQVKCKNLEEELANSGFVVSQLQRKVDQFKQINTEMENNLKNVRAEFDHVTMETDSKEQQIRILKSQVEGTKSQIKIIEEELYKKSQNSHDLQIKIQDYSEEVKKMTELQQKIKALNSNIVSYEKEITALKSEQNSLLAENNLLNQKVQMQNSEINDLTMTLQKRNAELEKESVENHKHLNKVKALEDELFKQKHSIKGLTTSSEKVSESLKQEIYALHSDKKAVEREVETLNDKISELNINLKRTKDELAKETRERQVKESKILQMETEVHKHKMNIKEIISSSEKSGLNLQNENAILRREKTEALQKNISLGSEVRTLKEKLQHTQMETEQKQRENSGLQLRYQQKEEQLEKCKKMLEDLKSKLELQKEGYERQLLLVRTEIEKKLILLHSEITNNNEKSRQQAHIADLSEMLKKYLTHNATQTKTVHQTTVESKQLLDQQLQLQVKMDNLQQERTKLNQELSKAKSQIAQLEEEKQKLNSKISSLQNLCNEQAMESAKSKQLLTDSEWKLKLRENEDRSLEEQIESYVKEVNSLQEKLLTLELKMQTENQRVNKQEVSGSSHRYVITTETENNPEVLEQVKQDKTETVHSQSLQDSTTKKALSSSASTLLQKDMQNVLKSQIKPDEPVTVTTHGYMALCGLTEQGRNESQSTKTRIYQTKEIYETVNMAEKHSTDSGGKLTVTYSTSQMLQDLKGGTGIQDLIKFKLLDDEVLRKLQMGFITVEEVLAQYTGKPATIAGVYVESSRKKISFLEAAEKGFLAKTYAHEFLEAQAATGSLTDLATGQTYSVAEALARGFIETSLQDKLMEAEKAVRGYVHAGKKLSVLQAIEERVLDRYKGKKILEVQVSSGGLINPEIGVRVPASIAVDQGLLNKETLEGLYNPVSNPKGFHNPDTGQKAYYSEILETCLYDIDGCVFLFPFGDRHLTSTSPMSPHRVSVVNSSCGAEMSAYEAFKGKYIDKKTYLFLSKQECQWHEKSAVDASGSPTHIITDVKSGRQLCLESALSQRFLEKSELDSYRQGLLSICEIADLIFSRMVVVDDVSSPIAGFWDNTQRKRLSVLQGFQQGLTDRTTALRLLEAQACTGGLCDPSSGEKVPVSEAVKRGLVDEVLSQQLQLFEQAFNGIVHPKTAKTLSIPQAIQEGLFPNDAGFRCIEFQLLTGGLVNPDTHDRVLLEEVIQSGLVDKVTATVLKDEKFHNKSLTCPKTKRRITFREALERSVYDCHTGLRLLEATKVLGFGAKSTFHYIWAYRQ